MLPRENMVFPELLLFICYVIILTSKSVLVYTVKSPIFMYLLGLIHGQVTEPGYRAKFLDQVAWPNAKRCSRDRFQGQISQPGSRAKFQSHVSMQCPMAIFQIQLKSSRAKFQSQVPELNS